MAHFATQPDYAGGKFSVDPMTNYHSEIARVEREISELEKPPKFTTSAKIDLPQDFQPLDIPGLIVRTLTDNEIEKSAMRTFAGALLAATD